MARVLARERECTLVLGAGEAWVSASCSHANAFQNVCCAAGAPSPRARSRPVTQRGGWAGLSSDRCGAGSREEAHERAPTAGPAPTEGKGASRDAQGAVSLPRPRPPTNPNTHMQPHTASLSLHTATRPRSMARRLMALTLVSLAALATTAAAASLPELLTLANITKLAKATAVSKANQSAHSLYALDPLDIKAQLVGGAQTVAWSGVAGARLTEAYKYGDRTLGYDLKNSSQGLRLSSTRRGGWRLRTICAAVSRRGKGGGEAFL